MNIGYVSIYGEVYSHNKVFDPTSCTIGQNLLYPLIMLKDALEHQGHSFQTADMFEFEDIDVLVFQDLSNNSWLTINNLVDRTKYILKGKRKNDYLLKSVKSKKKIKKILIMQEPEVVCPASYNLKYHQYFDYILTWNDKLIGGKYCRFCYPQPKPKKDYKVDFRDKHFLTMICGNKTANYPNELYSKRREVIDYCNKRLIDFDLYGFGWNKEGLYCYKGIVKNKLDVLSKYKFSICFENMTNIDGYITEKIFDCFFAGVVPIYLGADNVTDFIPPDTFIDFRKFSSIEELIRFLNSIDELKYQNYLTAIENFVDSDSFNNIFSVDAYVKNMMKYIVQ